MTHGLNPVNYNLIPWRNHKNEKETKDEGACKWGIPPKRHSNRKISTRARVWWLLMIMRAPADEPRHPRVIQLSRCERARRWRLLMSLLWMLLLDETEAVAVVAAGG